MIQHLVYHSLINYLDDYLDDKVSSFSCLNSVLDALIYRLTSRYFICNPSFGNDRLYVLHFSCHRLSRVRRDPSKVEAEHSQVTFPLHPSLCEVYIALKYICGSYRGDHPSRDGSFHCYPMLSATPELDRRCIYPRKSIVDPPLVAPAHLLVSFQRPIPRSCPQHGIASTNTYKANS